MKIKSILKKLCPELLLQFSASFMLFIYAPVTFYWSDPNQYTYDIYDILYYMVPVCLLFFIASALLLVLFRKISRRFHKLILIFYLIGFIATYIQGSYLSGFLPVLDGSEIIWSAYGIQRVWSVLLWLTVSSAVFFLYKKTSETVFCKLIGGAATTGMVLLLLTLIISGMTVKDAMKNKYNIAMSSGYMMDMSNDTNFVIFLMDGVDATAYCELAENHPEYKDIFKDFTCYKNAMGAYPYTSRAVPYILYGKWYENEQGIYDYTTEAIKNSPLLLELESQNYKLTAYMTDLLNIDGVYGTFDNVTKSEKLVRPIQFCKMQIMFAGLRFLPFDLKQYCVLTPENITWNSMRECSLGENYSMADDWVYRYIISTDVTEVRQKQFHYIHINGAHNPFDFDAEVNRTENGTYESCVEASVTIVGAYLDKLRASGTYDNTVIVVLADHGYGRGKEEPYDKQNPILFIKGINEKHEYQISDAPVSYEDLQTAYQRLLKGAESKDVFDCVDGNQRERRYLMMSYNNSSLVEYIQYGNAADEGTMVATGVIYPAV